MDIIADIDMAHHANHSGKCTVGSYPGASRYTCAGCNRSIFAYVAVVGNMHLIIEYDAILNHRMFKSTAVYGGTGANLNVIANTKPTQLADFLPPHWSGSKAETICSQYGAAVHNTSLTDMDIVINNHTRENTAICPYPTIVPDIHIGCQHNTLAYYGPPLDNGIGSNCRSFMHISMFRYYSACMDARCHSGTVIVQLCYPGIAGVGGLGDQTTNRTLCSKVGMNYHHGSPGSSQITQILLAGNKRQFPGAGGGKRCQSSDDYTGIPGKFQVKRFSQLCQAIHEVFLFRRQLVQFVCDLGGDTVPGVRVDHRSALQQQANTLGGNQVTQYFLYLGRQLL